MLSNSYSRRLFSSWVNIKSALYVPGNQEKMLNKCVQFNPSVIIPDLEDSVPYAEKARAREVVKSKLAFLRAEKPNVKIVPRPNSLGSGEFYNDMKALITKETYNLIDGFHVPKFSTVDDFVEIDAFLVGYEKKFDLEDGSYKLLPNIETTEGLLNLRDILKVGKKRIIVAGFGGDDFTNDFEVKRGPADEELDFARKMFALTCHACKVIAIDTPYVHFKNSEGLKKEIEYLKKVGFKGKFAIHPTQVDIINSEFMPSDEEIQRAKRIAEAYEKEGIDKGIGAINFENEMVDTPVYKRAVNLLKRAGVR